MNALAAVLHANGDDPLQHEHKYLPDAEAARRVWRAAAAHLRPEHSRGRCAHMRTTYFDTLDHVYYRQGDGATSRRVRVREYAMTDDPDEPPVLGEHCFVEFKQTCGSTRKKARIAVRRDEVMAQLAELVEVPLQPCVATWYRRRALVDGDHALRVTLDDHVVLCKPRPIGSGFDELRTSDVLARGPACVLEFKCLATPPPWLIMALRELREAQGFSKFLLAMDAANAAGLVPDLHPPLAVGDVCCG